MLLAGGATLPSQKLYEALELEKQGHPTEAVARLEAIIFEYPTWELPRIEVARLQLKIGTDLALAQRQLQAAQKLAPFNPRIPFLLGLVQEERGDFATAIEWQEAALKLRDTFHEARFRLATLYANLEHWEAAERHYRRYVESNPQAVGARIQWALVLEQLQEFSLAEKQLQRAVKMQPESSAFRTRLLEFYERTGQTERMKLFQESSKDNQPMRILKKSVR